MSLLIVHCKGKRHVVDVEHDSKGIHLFKLLLGYDITTASSDKISDILNDTKHLEVLWQQFPGKAYGKLITRSGTLKGEKDEASPYMALDPYDEPPTWGMYRVTNEDGIVTDLDKNRSQRLVLCPLSRGGQFRLRSHEDGDWICVTKSGFFQSTANKAQAACFSLEFVCTVCLEPYAQFGGLYNADGSVHDHMVCTNCASKLDTGYGGTVLCPMCKGATKPASREASVLRRALGSVPLIPTNTMKIITETVHELIRSAEQTGLNHLYTELKGKIENAGPYAILIPVAWLCSPAGKVVIGKYRTIGEEVLTLTLAGIADYMISSVWKIPRYLGVLERVLSTLPMVNLQACDGTVAGSKVLKVLLGVKDGMLSDQMLLDFFGEEGAAIPHKPWDTVPAEAEGGRDRIVSGAYSYEVGTHRAMTLGELRKLALLDSENEEGKEAGLVVSVARYLDIAEYIMANPGAVVQAASQANALEMPTENTTVEVGLKFYLDDKTQGPAVVLTTLPSLFHRITTLGDFNALSRLGIQAVDKTSSSTSSHKKRKEMGSSSSSSSSAGMPFVKNGYVQVNGNWEELATRLKSRPDDVMVMTLSNAPVTGRRRVVGDLALYDRQSEPSNSANLLTSNQIFSWAVPNDCYGNSSMVGDGYTAQHSVLQIAYESALLFAELRRKEMGLDRQKLALTLVGGGAFNVPRDFITAAMEGMLRKLENLRLDVTLILFDSDPITLLGTYHGGGGGGGGRHTGRRIAADEPGRPHPLQLRRTMAMGPHQLSEMLNPER